MIITVACRGIFGLEKSFYVGDGLRRRQIATTLSVSERKGKIQALPQNDPYFVRL